VTIVSITPLPSPFIFSQLDPLTAARVNQAFCFVSRPPPVFFPSILLMRFLRQADVFFEDIQKVAWTYSRHDYQY